MYHHFYLEGVFVYYLQCWGMNLRPPARLANVILLRCIERVFISNEVLNKMGKCEILGQARTVILELRRLRQEGPSSRPACAVEGDLLQIQ